MKLKTMCVMAIAGTLPALQATAADPALTIYNQNFAVVRDSVHLDLQTGENKVSFSDTTAHVEPDSVILRDPAGKWTLQVLEQNYRADPISEGLLLHLNEGKAIDFVVNREKNEIVQGTIVRSAYVPHTEAMNRYGSRYQMEQSARAYGSTGEPVIQLPDGKLQFGLPGKPVFPSLPGDTILKPTLAWILQSSQAGALDAELSYVTGGMSWEASYNLVGTDKDNNLDLVGWVTMDNQSGKSFNEAHIKLMAGDVSKLRGRGEGVERFLFSDLNNAGFGGGRPPVSEKAFDEYHLYTIERPATLLDRETKQVEFTRANGVASDRFYVYDGVKIDPNQYQGWGTEQIMQNREYGTQSQTQVWVMREIKNTKENGLGIPLPAGRTRFYQRDDDGQLEFTGENIIKHTPTGETLRFYTGSAFDVVGERTRTNFACVYDQHWADESFQIKVRNHKKEGIEVRVVEHLYRGMNWEIKTPTEPFVKTESQTAEFRVSVPPDGEKIITYTAHYTW